MMGLPIYSEENMPKNIKHISVKVTYVDVIDGKKLDWQKELFGKFVEVYAAFVHPNSDSDDIGLLSTPEGTEIIKKILESLGYNENSTSAYWFNIKNYYNTRENKLKRILNEI